MFGVTGPMIKASSSDAGSFVRSAAFELEMGYEDLANDCNRQYAWNGDGKLATVSANAVASTIITATGRESFEDGVKFLDVGMVIDILTSAGVMVAQGVSISALSGTTTATITLNQAVTTSSTDIIVRSGSYNNEIQGLLYSLDGGTGSIYSVSRTTYPSFGSNVINRNVAQLTLDSMQQTWNEGLRRGGKKDAKYQAIYCDFDSQRFYQKLLAADKRYVNSMQGDGGFAKKTELYLEFNGAPIVPDKDCPQRLFMLPSEILENWVLAEMEFADEQGTMYIAQTSVDALEVRVRYFANLFNSKPSACAVLRNYISP